MLFIQHSLFRIQYSLLIIASIGSILLFTACGNIEFEENELEKRLYSEYNQQFFDRLKSLCGETLRGKTEYPKASGHELTNASLKFVFSDCDVDRIEIDFFINEVNRSVLDIQFNKDENLLLKHRHRPVDGLDEIQDAYGGIAVSEANPLKMSFFADQETTRIHPEASANIWTLEFDEINSKLIYSLKRGQTQRFKAEFDFSVD
jgi:hypothetical protein